MTDQSFNKSSAFVLYFDPEYAQIARSAPKSMIRDIEGLPNKYLAKLLYMGFKFDINCSSTITS